MAATFNIVIKVDANAAISGTRRVDQALERTRSKAMEVNRAIRNLFGFFVVKEAVMGLYKLSDGYTVLQNRLRSVSKDQANLNGLTEATFKIAQETRSSWTATAELYARVARNSKEVGASQQELLTVTRALNHAMIVGGATSMEASAGLVQLSQGLASGTLRGDELRAVLEQLPVVADVIAKHLGVTRGELRDLGKAGKIGAREVVDAFLKAAPELEREFGRTIPTIAQSFDMLRNAAEKFFGEAGTGSGVLAGIANVIIFVSDNFDTFGKVLLAVGQAILGLMVLKGVITLLHMLAIAIAANPFTALLMAVGTGILLLRQFGDQVNTNIKVWTNIEGVFVTVGDLLRVLWDDFKKLIGIVKEFVEDAWGSLTQAFSTGLPTDGIEFSLRNVLIFIAGFVGTAVGLISQVKDKGLEIFGGFAVTVGEAFINVARAVAIVFGEMINHIVRLMNFLTGKVDFQGMKLAGMEGHKKGLRGKDLENYIKENTQASQVFSEVNFDFKNPLHGASDLTRGLITDAVAETKATTQKFMSEMDKYIDTVIVRGHDKAVERLGNVKKETIGNEKGTVVPPAPSESEKNAWEALLRKLDQLLKKSNEVREAEMKLAEAHKLLDNPRIQGELEKRGLTVATVISDYAEELKPALVPLEHWADLQIEAMAAMHGSTAEAEHAAAVQAIVNELTEKGMDLKEHEINQIERITTLQEHRARVWKIEQGILDGVTADYQKYTDTLEALRNLTDKAAISQAELSREFAKAQAAFTATNDADYEKFLEKSAANDPVTAGANKAKEELESMYNLSTSISDAIVSVAGALEEFMVTSAVTGEMAWEDAAKAIEQTLARLAAKIIEQWLLMQLFNSLLPGAGAAGGIVNAVSGGQTIADGSDLSFVTGGGYSTGGSYMVGGVGGPDSQRVMFNLSPGERVDFTPPGSSREGDTGSGPVTPAVDFGSMVSQMTAGIVDAIKGVSGGQQQGKTTVVNKWDDKDVLDTVGSSEGERVILNIVRRNPQVIRSLIRR
jgi:tape measure domain-containing protein